jgi:hypothetical protein
LDKILARAAACTPVPAKSTWASPASSRLSTSFGFMFMFTTILAGSWETVGNIDAFHCGFGTSTAVLFSW